MARFINKDFFSFAATFVLIIALVVGLMNLISRGFVSGDGFAEEIIAAHRADEYGGTTPQETMALFVKALEKGDMRLASKYFILENQEEILSELEAGKKAGTITILLNDLSGIDKGTEVFEGYYRFTTTVEPGVQLTYDLVFDDLAGVWKIERL